MLIVHKINAKIHNFRETSKKISKNVFKKIEPDIDAEKEIQDIKTTLNSESKEKKFTFKKWI